MLRPRVPHSTTPRLLRHYPEQPVAAYCEGLYHAQGWVDDGPLRGPGWVQREVAALQTNHAGGTSVIYTGYSSVSPKHASYMTYWPENDRKPLNSQTVCTLKPAILVAPFKPHPVRETLECGILLPVATANAIVN